MKKIKEPSYVISATKADAEKKIQKLYKNSVYREKSYIFDYAEALFNNPEIINNITNQIAVELGYQKAIKELKEDILLMA